MAGKRLIEVENIDQFRRELRKQDKEVRSAVKELDKDTATQISQRVEPFIPVKSGRLKRTLKAGADNRGGTLAAGTSSRVRYAPVIHWGFPRRHIKRTGFMLRGMAAFGREYDGDFANFYLKRLIGILDSFGDASEGTIG
jgi:hypothetical protein